MASAIMVLVQRQLKLDRQEQAESEPAGLASPITQLPKGVSASPPVPVTQSRFALPRTPTLVIGIAGGSASGKSFFTSALRQRLHQIDGVWCACPHTHRDESATLAWPSLPAKFATSTGVARSAATNNIYGTITRGGVVR